MVGITTLKMDHTLLTNGTTLLANQRIGISLSEKLTVRMNSGYKIRQLFQKMKMNKEKFVSNALCALACIVIWIITITILTLLHFKRFNITAGVLMMAAWIWICRFIKKKVHNHYLKDKRN